MKLRVVIAGGGLGGLCLAQGLIREGVRADVFERDAIADTAQGYRIYVNQAGSRALHACLPPSLWEAFVATAGRPYAGLRFLTEQMRELLSIEQHRIEGKPRGAPFDPVTSEHPVSRTALRRVLLGGLHDAIHFGKGLVRYELHSDSVTAFFADGTSVEGDVLVAADGVGSRVRQQYLPQAKVVDTGIIAVGGTLTFDSRASQWLPDAFVTGMTNILPPDGCGMFIAPYRRRPTHESPDDGASPSQGPRPFHDALGEHVFWAFITRPSKLSADVDPRTEQGPQLQRRVLSSIASWHPRLVRLVADTNPTTVTAIRIQSAEPIPRWRTSRVVLLGDAIHTMTPLQGLGGNTAFRDAALLRRRLVEADRGHRPLLDALASYEEAMTDYGFHAVRLSRKIGELAVSDDRFGRGVFKSVLRIVDGIPPLKQRMFGARQVRRDVARLGLLD